MNAPHATQYLLFIVTGPYSAKNEPIIDDQRLNRALAVMYLDRRTHHGDPPAWLPPFWSKPGIYPLTPESINIIKMVSSLPFDRNASPSSAILPPLATNGMMSPNNFYQHQPNILFGGGGNNLGPFVMGHPMMSPLLQQQQQQQLQLQYQQPPLPSSSPFTQRKPIIISTPLMNSSPQLQSTSSSQARTKGKKNQQQRHSLPSSSMTSSPSLSSLSSSASATPAKISRKKVKSMLEKRRVRFTEDQPEIKFFDSEKHWVDGLEHDIYEQEDVYYADGNDDLYYRHPMDYNNNEDYQYYDDDDYGYTQQRDASGYYSGEYVYDQHHYPDDYYIDKNNDYDDYEDYQESDNNHDYQYTSRKSQHRQSSYDDDNKVDYWDSTYNGMGYDAEWTDDDKHYYYNDEGKNDDIYLEEEDQYEQQVHPSTDYEDTRYQYSPPQRNRISHRSSSSSLGTTWYDHARYSISDDYYDPPLRRSTLSCANRHMWQPLRGTHSQ
ncbi:hypothetical protein BC941DRAFT_415216 [Chlamydoabsidia padenii]|nr:hypothetical protein BC941DRAFT_415216 [Chlamydoabsidia padenii]